MWERLFGIQLGAWATVQCLLMAGVILAILWVLSKIELRDGGVAPTDNERVKK